MDKQNFKHIVESVLLAAGKPLSLEQLLGVFGEGEKPERDELRDAITALQEDYAGRGIELVEVASGFRIQVSQAMEPWVSRLIEEKPTRYSRALLETLALVAYRQPITRGEIEDIRGVSVSSSIMKTLQEREWVRVVGHRDVPGRPAMYGTTRQFLDYFNLKGLDDLPTLMELRDIDTINAELELAWPGEQQTAVSDESAEAAGEDAVGDDSPAARGVQVPVDVLDKNETLH
jgi:segregation and condensation protein B